MPRAQERAVDLGFERIDHVFVTADGTALAVMVSTTADAVVKIAKPTVETIEGTKSIRIASLF
jgi:hypothetical protein